ncbi:hypothetical protein D3C80_1618480 [compost metagenome]
MAMSGSMNSSTNTSFWLRDLITEKLVTSEPVPLVVGMATKQGLLRPLSLRQCHSAYITALAASMTEPPPKAITRSG